MAKLNVYNQILITRLLIRLRKNLFKSSNLILNFFKCYKITHSHAVVVNISTVVITYGLVLLFNTAALFMQILLIYNNFIILFCNNCIITMVA